MMIIFCYLWIS